MEEAEDRGTEGGKQVMGKIIGAGGSMSEFMILGARVLSAKKRTRQNNHRYKILKYVEKQINL